MLEFIAILLIALAAVVGLSYLVESLRRAPPTPAGLSWAPDVPVRWTEVDGVRLRYVVAGQGPPLVLLHTLRSQLDLFQDVFPTLSRRYTVYALDYPGHGHSDIPTASYTADYLIGKIAGFLDRLDITGAVLVGESIGGAAALALAARHHPRVRAVVAINPYDYGKGRGLARSSILARLIFGVAEVPILGATVTRLRQYPVITAVFNGGLHRRKAMPAPLAREMYQVGNRPGHAAAFGSLVHHWPTWEALRGEYAAIDRPVLLLYGEQDWSRPDERAANAALIPGAEFRTVPNAGHFLSLDAPQDMLEQVTGFVDRLSPWRTVERA
jgi:pimeloyl-ACP methyl ester carboxylesterase